VDGLPGGFDPAAVLAEFAGMGLHLIKLCVGAESIEDLADWIERKLAEKRAAGLPVEQYHTTRMVPKRLAELLDGGSLYWVIKGSVQVRQRLVDVRPFIDDEGIGRCRLVLEPVLVPTEWQPRRPFQGWRYFEPKDAPRDLKEIGGDGLPPALAAALAELGLR
jgi:hypothetical protein